MIDWNGTPVFGSPPENATAVVRPSAYAVVTDHTARLAIVRTPLGLYLPGGGMDPGECPIETVVREVREECGLEANVGDWMARAIDFVWSPNDRTHFEKRSTFVNARCSDFRGAGVEPDHELEWMSPADAMTELAHPSHRWAVGEWLTWHERSRDSA